MNESQIFAEAIKLACGSARVAYLNRVCAENPELRQQVEELLRIHDQNSQFLNPVVAPAESTKAFASEQAINPPGTITSTFKPSVGEVGAVISGRYRLVEPIGEGGMGSVWLAQQTEPVKRKVAIKLIKPGMDSKQVLARFDAERQALAMMDHPNIAKVYDGGLHDGRPYFVMELVKGTPITEFCDTRKLTPKERLELFIPVCNAIQHAHQKGIIHRDIKPSNVLIALYDDLPVAKVIDFGIAKATGGTLTEQTIDTTFGGVVGTPQYMSPEQATFNNLDIDTRSDIYALGVLLYELLVGTPPFARKELEKKGLLEILRVVREEDPPRPSVKFSTAETQPSISANRGTEPKKLMGILRNELDWIVLKALEKDRTRRYETATSFAQDVQRYLSGDPVQAHPPSTAYRVKKFLRRHRGQVIAASIVLLGLVLGIAGMTVGLLRATKAEADATAALGQVSSEQVKTSQALAKATATDADSRKQLARQYVEQGAQLLENGNAADALHWHIAAFAKEQDLINPDRERVHRTRIAATMEACTRPTQILFHTKPVRQAAYSPDGRKLVTLAWSTPDKLELRVWDALSGQQLGPVITPPPDNNNGQQAFLRFDSTGSKVILVKNGTNIATFSTLEVWEAHTGQLVFRSTKCIRRPTGLSSVSEFSQTQLLEVDPTDPTKPWPASAVRLIQLDTLQRVELPKATATNNIRASRVTIDPTQRYCFVPTDENGQCEIWSLKPLQRIRQWGDKSLLSAGTKAADGQTRVILPQPSVQFSPDGQQLVVILSGPKSMIYSMESATGRDLFPPKELPKLRSTSTRYGIDITADASRFLIDAVDNGVGEVTIYDATTGKSLAAYKPHPAMTVREAKFHPSGAYAIISSQLIQPVSMPAVQQLNSTVATHELFDIALAKPVGPPIFSVAKPVYSADATTVLIQDEQGTEKLRNVRSGEPVSGPLGTAARGLSGSSSQTSKFNSDGRFLVTVNEDTARLWDTQTGQPTTSLLRHRGRLTACEFNPVFDQCATLCEDATVQLWENRPSPKSLEAWSSETIGMLEVDSTGTVVTARSPLQNGKLLLVWNVEAGQQLREFLLPKRNRQIGEVGRQCVQAAAGGRTLVMSGGGLGFQILDSATGRVLRHEPITENQGYFAAISPDRLRVVSLRYPDGEARWWDAATGTPLTEPIAGNAADLNFGPVFQDRPNPFLVTLRYRTEPGRAPEVEPTIWDPTKNGPTRLPWRPAGSSPVVDGAFQNLPPLPITRNGRTLLPLIGTDGLSAGWQLLDEATQQELARLPAGRADFTPEGHFAYVHGANSLALWVAKSGQPSTKFKLPDTSNDGLTNALAVNGFRFNRDGSRILFFRATSGSSSNWLRAPPELFDVQSGDAIGPPLTQADRVVGFEWSPDGTRFVTWGGREVQLWESQTGQRLGRPLKHKDVVQLARFSPDSKRLISRTNAIQSTEIIRVTSQGRPSTDGSGRWLPDTKRVLFSIPAFTPGGEVQLWDVASGESLAAPRLNMAWLTSVGRSQQFWEALIPHEIGPFFSEDGQRLFTTPTPNSIQAWKIPLDTRPLSELIATAEAISGRRFQEPGNLIRLTEPEWTAARQITPDVLAPVLSLETQLARTSERAVSNYLAGHWKVALAEVNRAILLGSNQAEHFQMRGWCRAVLGDHQAALVDLTKALELGITGGEIFAQRGAVLQALARYTEAAAEFKKLFQFPVPSWPRGWIVPAKRWWSDVATLMSWAGHMKEYRRACDQLLANDGLKAPYNQGEFMAFLYSENGLDDYTLLLSIFRNELEKESNPEQIARWKSRLGLALFRAKQYEDAVKMLEPIDLNILPEITFYRGGGNDLVLAMAYHHRGDRNKAAEYLRRGQEQSVVYKQQQAKTPSPTRLVPSILVREATQLIGSGPKPELAPPPRPTK